MVRGVPVALEAPDKHTQIRHLSLPYPLCPRSAQGDLVGLEARSLLYDLQDRKNREDQQGREVQDPPFSPPGRPGTAAAHQAP